MILCHFIFEYVHHYYDGNGRLGRYLFSSDLYLETHNIFSFSTSSSLEHEKERYYSVLKKQVIEMNLATQIIMLK